MGITTFIDRQQSYFHFPFPFASKSPRRNAPVVARRHNNRNHNNVCGTLVREDRIKRFVNWNSNSYRLNHLKLQILAMMVHTPPSPRIQFLARSKRTRLFNRHSAIVYSDTVVLPCIVNRRHNHASVMHDIHKQSQLSHPRPPPFRHAIPLVSSRHHTSSWILAVIDKFISYHQHRTFIRNSPQIFVIIHIARAELRFAYHMFLPHPSNPMTNNVCCAFCQ